MEIGDGEGSNRRHRGYRVVVEYQSRGKNMRSNRKVGDGLELESEKCHLFRTLRGSRFEKVLSRSQDCLKDLVNEAVTRRAASSGSTTCKSKAGECSNVALPFR